MNRVELIGNLARDPELRATTGQNQTSVCRFTIAVNSGYGDKKKTDFIQIVVFGRMGENCDKYLSKGKKVAVTGRINTGSYTNKEGQKVYTTDVIADNVEFLSQNSTTGGTGDASQPAEAQPQPEQVEGFVEVADDDIPF